MVSICAVGDNAKAGMELTLQIKAPCKSKCPNIEIEKSVA